MCGCSTGAPYQRGAVHRAASYDVALRDMVLELSVTAPDGRTEVEFVGPGDCERRFPETDFGELVSERYGMAWIEGTLRLVIGSWDCKGTERSLIAVP